MKPSDSFTVPLCYECHSRQHSKGEVTFWKNIENAISLANALYLMTGDSADALHEVFKLRFLGTEKIQSMGYSIEIPKSTTKLSTQEFTDYLDKIDTLMRSIDIALPYPTDLYYEAMR